MEKVTNWVKVRKLKLKDIEEKQENEREKIDMKNNWGGRYCNNNGRLLENQKKIVTTR